MSHRPPFRADPVGSLLRPQALRQAFKTFAGGGIDASEFRKIQDDSIRAAVQMQEQVGLTVVTDGEFRRSSYWARLSSTSKDLRSDKPRTAFVTRAGAKPLSPRPLRRRGCAVCANSRSMSSCSCARLRASRQRSRYLRPRPCISMLAATSPIRKSMRMRASSSPI
jgi:hypothetical protein